MPFLLLVNIALNNLCNLLAIALFISFYNLGLYFECRTVIAHFPPSNSCLAGSIKYTTSISGLILLSIVTFYAYSSLYVHVLIDHSEDLFIDGFVSYILAIAFTSIISIATLLTLLKPLKPLFILLLLISLLKTNFFWLPYSFIFN